METMDDVAATFLKEKRKEGMDQAYKRTQKKCTGKWKCMSHVLKVSFVDTL